MESAVACASKGSEDSAGVPVYGLTKVHGDGEKKDEEEKVDAKKRLRESPKGFWREQAAVHPDDGGDGEDTEDAEDDARRAF
jgi:hypothetical protein